VSVQLDTHAALSPWKRTQYPLTVPCRESNPGRPARSQVTILSYTKKEKLFLSQQWGIDSLISFAAIYLHLQEINLNAQWGTQNSRLAARRTEHATAPCVAASTDNERPRHGLWRHTSTLVRCALNHSQPQWRVERTWKLPMKCVLGGQSFYSSLTLETT
jgi:hypothetical protein